MPLATETKDSPQLVTSRTPVGPNNASEKTPGDQAVNDALLIIIGAWLLLAFLYWSLRRHNV